MEAITQTTESVELALLDLFQMLSKGHFVDAMYKYLHTDVTLHEGNDTVKSGKEYCITVEEEILSDVAEFMRYEVKDYAINGDTTFYEAIMEYRENGGKTVRVDQCVVSRWADGKIIRERFYHS